MDKWIKLEYKNGVILVYGIHSLACSPVLGQYFINLITSKFLSTHISFQLSTFTKCALTREQKVVQIRTHRKKNSEPRPVWKGLGKVLDEMCTTILMPFNPVCSIQIGQRSKYERTIASHRCTHACGAAKCGSF